MNARRVLPLILALVAVGGAIWYLLRTSSEPAQQPAGHGSELRSEPQHGLEAAGTPTTSTAEPSGALSEPSPANAPAQGRGPGAPEMRGGGARDIDERAGPILEAELGKPVGPSDKSRPVDRLLAAYETHELDLVAALNRAGHESPATLHQLFALRKKGASAEEQKRFVRANFRGDAGARVIALKWIDDRDPAAPRDVPVPPPESPRASDLGTVEQVEKSPAVAPK
jgi:hypothetical protein